MLAGYVKFPTHYLLIIQKLLADGVTALYSHKARFFNQSELTLYLNYNINGYIERILHGGEKI